MFDLRLLKTTNFRSDTLVAAAILISQMARMLTKIKAQIYFLYRKVVSSIAFYPVIIAVVFLLIAVVLVNFENNILTKYVQDHIKCLLIDDPSTARSMLSTLIGGIISLTVFSFSMVMVLLNQASTNFSPRLLPGLISDKKHQIVLGIYIGTIIYNIIVLVGVTSSDDVIMLNGFSVLVGIAFGILSLCMFVFFIHSISNEIQINTILSTIFIKTKGRLEHIIDGDRKQDKTFRSDKSWNEVTSTRTGYYQGVNLSALKQFMKENDTNVKIIPVKGTYIFKEQVVFSTDIQLDDDASEVMNEFIIFSSSFDLTENYILGLRQIAEVGIKAMSPGINDPGTAIMTLDYLTELLALRLQITDNVVIVVEGTELKIESPAMPFDKMLYSILATYRQYCKHDIVVMKKMLQMLQYLSKREPKESSYTDALKYEIVKLMEDAEQCVKNEHDLQHLRELHAKPQYSF